MDNTNITYRVKADGTANPTYVDMLDEDKPLAGQKFTCVSFVSPEKIIKTRELFNFQHFLKQWDMNKSLEKFNHFLNFLAYKYNLNFDTISKDLQDFCKDEKDNLFLTTLYVGPVGLWMPFHPESYKTGRVEYLEDELNQIMQEKNKNEASAKVEFEKRVRDTKEKAMEDNKKKALASGNVLTQTIDQEGNLISVKDMNKDISVADLRKELFEGENIVTDKKSDRGLSKVAELRELPQEMTLE
jgi:hypothetical protein